MVYVRQVASKALINARLGEKVRVYVEDLRTEPYITLAIASRF